jgi:stage V sporulation protein G
MPSRKLTAHCPNCRSKNHLRAAFCNQCGARLQESQTLRDDEGRAKLYADIAHPINSACREMIQQRVIVAFEEEKKRSELPGYVPSYDDFEVEEHVVEATEPRAIRIDGAAPAPPGPVQPVRPEPADIQAVEGPRGPHRAPSQPPQGQDGPAKSFGAGVFD